MSSEGSANAEFLGVIRSRMAALTDDELLRVVSTEAQDYRREAIEIAWAELRRRGVEAPSPQQIEKIQQRDAEDRRTALLRKVRWLKFYVFLIAADLAVAVYYFIGDFAHISAGWLAFYSFRLGLLGCLLPGMVKRKGWAYHLNWIYVALTVYTMAARWSNVWWGLLFYVAAWALPNFIYFRNRRQLFLPGGPASAEVSRY